MKKYKLSIPFEAKTDREFAKKMGFKWNPETKTWDGEKDEEKIALYPKHLAFLNKYNVNQSEKSETKTFDTGLGYYGTAKDMRRGYDGIESEI